jgi:hypothetical protein
VDAGLVRGHPDDTEEWMERDLSTRVGATDLCVCVEFPVESERVALADTEPIVERRRPTTGLRDAARADPNLVDLDHQSLSRSRPANLDRPDQGVSGIELALPTVGIHLVLRRAPAGVQAGERDRVSRLDRQARREITREVAVERMPLERDLVQSH